MKNDYLKTLWYLRFEKLKKAEESAAWAYQELEEKCLLAFGEKHEAVELLRQLVREERMHEKLADRLLKICRRNHTECGLI